MENNKNDAIVLLSGGQDSTTALFWAIKTFAKVTALGFEYGQKHRVEMTYAAKTCHDNDIWFNIIDLGGDVMKGSSLVGQGDHNEAHQINADLPASFTPGRNAIFLSIAASNAYLARTPNLVTGVCQTDFSGYPDCRQDFIDSMTQTMRLALGFPELAIHTPLMNMTKAETFKMANDLGVLNVIVNNTMTDYNGDHTLNEWGRGRLDNPASILRAKGFAEAREKGWLG